MDSQSGNTLSDQTASPYMLHGTAAAPSSADALSANSSAPGNAQVPDQASAVPPIYDDGTAQASQNAADAGGKAAAEALDKEWVEKAKEIVAQTRNDPFTQSNEISKAKAEYLKVRFNKDIKVAEDHAK